jgi:hypothetical protein
MNTFIVALILCGVCVNLVVIVVLKAASKADEDMEE